jgi:hypothetical protein
VSVVVVPVGLSAITFITQTSPVLLYLDRMKKNEVHSKIGVGSSTLTCQLCDREMRRLSEHHFLNSQKNSPAFSRAIEKLTTKVN